MSSNHLIEVGPGFYNLRAPFKVLLGLVDVGTHMSICKLSSGKFVVIDTIDLTTEQKTEFDLLTGNGTLIEAVLATHPFHTVYFPKFYSQYPSASYYGTPRHLLIQPQIPWKGDLNDKEIRDIFSPEIEMRIPVGGEFKDPKPEITNHWSNVFVFHRASKTVHNDDNIIVVNNPPFAYRMAGMKEGQAYFHSSITGPGLYPTKEAPWQYKQWVQALLKDWDFTNLCTAHNGNAVGNAKEVIRNALAAYEPTFKKISDKNATAAGEKPFDQEPQFNGRL